MVRVTVRQCRTLHKWRRRFGAQASAADARTGRKFKSKISAAAQRLMATAERDTAEASFVLRIFAHELTLMRGSHVVETLFSDGGELSALAFQFLDYPLVLVRPRGLSPDNSSGVVPYRAGKCCVLQADANKLSFLLKQVPLYVSLLDARVLPKPRVLASGSMAMRINNTQEATRLQDVALQTPTGEVVAIARVSCQMTEHADAASAAAASGLTPDFLRQTAPGQLQSRSMDHVHASVANAGVLPAPLYYAHKAPQQARWDTYSAAAAEVIVPTSLEATATQHHVTTVAQPASSYVDPRWATQRPPVTHQGAQAQPHAQQGMPRTAPVGTALGATNAYMPVVRAIQACLQSHPDGNSTHSAALGSHGGAGSLHAPNLPVGDHPSLAPISLAKGLPQRPRKEARITRSPKKRPATAAVPAAARGGRATTDHSQRHRPVTAAAPLGVGATPAATTHPAMPPAYCADTYTMQQQQAMQAGMVGNTLFSQGLPQGMHPAAGAMQMSSVLMWEMMSLVSMRTVLTSALGAMQSSMTDMARQMVANAFAPVVPLAVQQQAAAAHLHHAFAAQPAPPSAGASAVQAAAVADSGPTAATAQAVARTPQDAPGPALLPGVAAVDTGLPVVSKAGSGVVGAQPAASQHGSGAGTGTSDGSVRTEQLPDNSYSNEFSAASQLNSPRNGHPVRHDAWAATQPPHVEQQQQQQPQQGSRTPVSPAVITGLKEEAVKQMEHSSVGVVGPASRSVGGRHTLSKKLSMASTVNTAMLLASTSSSPSYTSVEEGSAGTAPRKGAPLPTVFLSAASRPGSRPTAPRPAPRSVRSHASSTATSAATPQTSASASHQSRSSTTSSAGSGRSDGMGLPPTTRKSVIFKEANSVHTLSNLPSYNSLATTATHQSRRQSMAAMSEVSFFSSVASSFEDDEDEELHGMGAGNARGGGKADDNDDNVRGKKHHHHPGSGSSTTSSSLVHSEELDQVRSLHDQRHRRTTGHASRRRSSGVISATWTVSGRGSGSGGGSSDVSWVPSSSDGGTDSLMGATTCEQNVGSCAPATGRLANRDSSKSFLIAASDIGSEISIEFDADELAEELASSELHLHNQQARKGRHAAADTTADILEEISNLS